MVLAQVLSGQLLLTRAERLLLAQGALELARRRIEAAGILEAIGISPIDRVGVGNLYLTVDIGQTDTFRSALTPVIGARRRLLQIIAGNDDNHRAVVRGIGTDHLNPAA